MEHHTIENLKATVNAARHCASVARSLALQGFTRHAAENRAAARVYMARARHIAATLAERAKERAAFNPLAFAVSSAIEAMDQAAEYVDSAKSYRVNVVDTCGEYGITDPATIAAAVAAYDQKIESMTERAAVQSAPVGKVKKGEYIRRTATARRVYIRGEYVRALRAYECQAADDMNSIIYIKSSTPVFFGFTY